MKQSTTALAAASWQPTPTPQPNVFTGTPANQYLDCSASGGSFWDRPPGCACLFWIQSGRGLDCSTSLPRGGLDLSQPSPNRRKVGLWNSLVGGRRYVTLAKWVIEVGHWPPSSLGIFSVIKETHFCGANCVTLLQCELLLRQLHLHKIHKSTYNLNWRIGAYSHFRDMNIELMSCQKPVVTFAPQLPTRSTLFCNVVPPFPPEQALFLPPIAAKARAGHEYLKVEKTNAGNKIKIKSYEKDNGYWLIMSACVKI